MNKHPKLLRSLFNLTADDASIPTNVELDEDIAKVGFLMHTVWPLLTRIVRIKFWLFIKYKWKLWAKACLYFIILVMAIAIAWFKVARPIFIPQYKKEVIVVYRKDSTMNMDNFLSQIAYMESRYDPSARRAGSQFWGLYQIGDMERINAGYGDIPWNVYKNHSEIQKLCMANLLKYNKKYLQNEIDYYSGKIVDGILITESGILGLAHLGCGFAKQCLHSGVIPEIDQYGNKPREYAKLGGYQLGLR